MGKKNRVKQLIGRFRRQLGTEIIALPYSIKGTTREMRLTMDLENDTFLICTNIPHFLAETSLKTIFSKMFVSQIVHIQFNSSTALYGDLKTGYRAGHFVFATIQDRKRAFEACKMLKKPIDLADVGFKTPAWHKSAEAKKSGKRKRKFIESDSYSSEEEAEEMKMCEDEVDLKKSNVDGWTLVTPEDKFSFRGKINRIFVGNEVTNTADSTIKESKKLAKFIPKKKNKGI